MKKNSPMCQLQNLVSFSYKVIFENLLSQSQNLVMICDHQEDSKDVFLYNCVSVKRRYKHRIFKTNHRILALIFLNVCNPKIIKTTSPDFYVPKLIMDLFM